MTSPLNFLSRNEKITRRPEGSFYLLIKNTNSNNDVLIMFTKFSLFIFFAIINSNNLFLNLRQRPRPSRVKVFQSLSTHRTQQSRTVSRVDISQRFSFLFFDFDRNYSVFSTWRFQILNSSFHQFLQIVMKSHFKVSQKVLMLLWTEI